MYVYNLKLLYSKSYLRFIESIFVVPDLKIFINKHIYSIVIIVKSYF